MSTLPDNVEKLLSERGIGKYQFYKEIGISAAAYSQWKSGANSPRMERIQTIADYFGVSVSTLLETEKAATPKDDGALLRFALFGDPAEEITDDDIERILDYARYVREKRNAPD